MILADTSVWIEHLRWPNHALVELLEAEEVAMHPFIVGELACGNLRNRRELLSLWARLPATPTATDAEALGFIDRHKLMGVGLRYVDVHLLASATLSGAAVLWTRDRQLATVAGRMRVGYDESR